MSLQQAETYGASGNILPMSIVKVDTSNDMKCVQAGAGDQGLGISQDWTRYAPWPALDDGYCAVAGENVKVFKNGQKGCKLQLDSGAGSVAPGTYIKPAASGYGTPVTANKDKYIAIARTAGTGGGIIYVDVEDGVANI